MNKYDVTGQYGFDGFPTGAGTATAVGTSSGKTLYVDSNAANAANSGASGQGESWLNPYATVNFAISQCSNEGKDVILVAGNHAETITDTSTTNSSGSTTGVFCVDKAGVTIIGMGRGTGRPTFTLGTATDATLEIRAADVTIKNLLVVSALADVAAGITVSNACDGATIESCTLRDGSATLELVLGISISASSDDVTIRDCEFITTAAGSGTLSAIKTVGVASRLRIYDNVFMGDWNAQVMDLDAAKITDLLIRDNIINSLDSGGVAIDTHSTSTGVITGNTIHVGSAVDFAIIAAACAVTDNIVIVAEGSNGFLSASTPAVGYAQKSYSTATAAKHSLFTVAGGPVKMTGFYGLVTTDVEDASVDISIQHTTTTPAGAVELASDLVCDDDAAGTIYNLPATLGDPLEAVTAGTHANIEADTILPIGTLSFTLEDAADTEGAYTWYMRYEPLAAGAYVVPATTD